MATKSTHTRAKRKSITLRDVVIHMEHMEQRLTAMIAKNTKDIASNTTAIKSNTIAIKDLDTRLTLRINTLEKNLNNRIDALDEDLTATIKDTLTIRRFVGMPVPTDE